MDIMGSTITLASVITIGMFVLGILNYLSNRNSKSRKESEEEKKKASEQEARLVRIEAMLTKRRKVICQLKQSLC